MNIKKFRSYLVLYVFLVPMIVLEIFVQIGLGSDRLLKNMIKVSNRLGSSNKEVATPEIRNSSGLV